MRIVGGAWRGRALAGPGAAGGLRPTQDRVRESLFNVLAGGRFGDAVTGARVLDLFAGTGALALEALSRGAAEAVLVDDGRAAARLIAENIRACHAADRARHLRRDARRPGPCPEAPFDLVFLDPPYGKSLGEAALAAAQAGGWIAPGALVVWEESAPVTPPAGLALRDTRRYGDTTLAFLEATA
ncbi:16S rRNA (guanine(966)-N(2))-methyltransferase RsmD [Rhodosalinus sediminis]|uniref:16S rRNA (guanine(966)-N(2))-methyltransferase RsmD n=1 Tax=Rhodosalinus sediminis TaxID=1940533 RepID=UPI0023569C1F|nr:16S rRNA (guanine(966)-N(2))-methyltransferase RsmD [Rhodosalinus sediminis]